MVRERDERERPTHSALLYVIIFPDKETEVQEVSLELWHLVPCSLVCLKLGFPVKLGTFRGIYHLLWMQPVVSLVARLRSLEVKTGKFPSWNFLLPNSECSSYWGQNKMDTQRKVWLCLYDFFVQITAKKIYIRLYVIKTLIKAHWLLMQFYH